MALTSFTHQSIQFPAHLLCSSLLLTQCFTGGSGHQAEETDKRPQVHALHEGAPLAWTNTPKLWVSGEVNMANAVSIPRE